MFSDSHDLRTIVFRRKLKNGATVFVELADDASISKDMEKLAMALDLRGSINVQLKKSNGRNMIFEINPRLSGTVHFRHLLGFTDAVWWVMLANDEPIPKYSPRYQKAIGVREYREKILVSDKK